MKRCPARDCGSPVPMAAKFCPRCGCRLRHPGGCVVLALLPGLGMVFVFLLAARDTAGSTPVDARDTLRTPPAPLTLPSPRGPFVPRHQ